MKVTLEFNLPEDREEYEYCYKGSDYINALREIVEYLRNKIKYEDDEDITPTVWANDLAIRSEVMKAHEKTYEKIFWICRENGFSPWEY